jgi:ribonucleotide monophosphatase NagD (HAD superfamily)
VVSFDREFNWEKLTIAFRALRRGALFVATNIDATAPQPEGEVPDAGAVIGALEGCSGRKLDVNVGKPSELMLQATLTRLGLPPEVTLLVGDRLETDIAMGTAAGMRTGLVLSGVTSREGLRGSSLQPDVVLEGLRDLPAWLGIP